MLKCTYYITLLIALAACGTSARMIILEGKVSTTGWKEEDRKHKYNVESGPTAPKITTGNQSDLDSSHKNIIWEDEKYEQIQENLNDRKIRLQDLKD